MAMNKPSIWMVAALALMAGCGPTPSQPQPATYDVVATRVFSNCTTRSCHSEIGRKGNLILTPDQAYGMLVDQPAANSAAAGRGKKRVVPGDPAASFLMQKLTSPAPDEGSRMPLSGEPLSSEDLDLLRRWIADGAKR
jgi:hypothetical protein